MAFAMWIDGAMRKARDLDRDGVSGSCAARAGAQVGAMGGPRGIVFRDVSTTSTLAALAREARAAAATLVASPTNAATRIEALLAACDYEGALADARLGGEDFERSARLSDEVACALARPEAGRRWDPTDLLRQLGAMSAPVAGARPCQRKRAEGFAYYALRPSNVLRAVAAWSAGGPVTVIGVRTIGTALSGAGDGGARRPRASDGSAATDRSPGRARLRPSGDLGFAAGSRDRASGARPDLRGSFPRWAARLCAYCSWRGADRAFADPAASTERAQSALVEATMHNAEQELGATPDPRRLRVVRPAVVDGRMQPDEWIADADDCLIKTDATSHGDDHLLPGPTDIAWDLAGVVVEWDLDDRERSDFLAAYASLSGDRAAERVAAYEVAYAAFRAAAWGMTPPSDDEDEIRRRAGERARLQACGRRALARSR